MSLERELYSFRVSHAVDMFVDFEVEELAKEEEYDTELKKSVSRHLKDNAEGTFLWVALARKMLEGILPCDVRLALKRFPPGLDPIYERMMKQVECSEAVKDCKCIITSAVLAQRPLHLKELGAIADLRMELREDQLSLKKQVQRCGSFLTIREGIVYLVHQSAKDFFTAGKGASIISLNHQEEHGKFAYRSLDLMSSILQEDICGLRKPGASSEEAHKMFSQSRFMHIGYACCYWVDHLAAHVTDDNRNQLSFFDKGEKVKIFLQKHLLHWLEVLSVLGKVSKGVLMFKGLRSLTDVSLLMG